MEGQQSGAPRGTARHVASSDHERDGAGLCYPPGDGPAGGRTVNDLATLPRRDIERIARELWPRRAAWDLAGSVRVVHRVLAGEPCAIAPEDAARIKTLAAEALSREPAARRVRVVREPQEAAP